MILAWNQANGLKNKLQVLFGKPDDIDPKHREILEYKLLSKNKETVNASLQKVILANTITTLFFLFFTLLYTEFLSTIQQSILCLFILFSILNTGAMLEQKKWVLYLDYARFF